MLRTIPVRAAITAVVVILLVATRAGAQPDLRAAGARLQQARAADGAGDVAGYYTHAKAAADMVPRHPVLVYHLARAAARSGRTTEALELLQRLEPIGAPRDPAADSGFVTLWELPAFRERVTSLTRATAPLVRSDTAFLIDRPNLIVENLAYDPAAKVFYVGSMALRTILRVDRSGRATPLLAAAAAIGQPLGMKVDSRKKTLWATAIWPVDSAKGRVRTTSELLAIDLPSGRIARRLAPRDTTRPHLLNDVVLTRDGSVYITDSEGGALWMLSPRSDSLAEFVRFPTTVLYPNGIALTPDGKSVLVAHQTGILAVNLATKALSPLAIPEGLTFMGIDGLYSSRSAIVGVANSSTVDQIVYGLLQTKRDSVTVSCSRTIERRHPAYQIPTTGTMVGDTLFYVANSQLRRLDNSGALRDPGESKQTVILRLPIPHSELIRSCGDVASQSVGVRPRLLQSKRSSIVPPSGSANHS